MVVIHQCDHCGTLLSKKEQRSVTIGNKTFDLCPKDKDKFEDFKSEFFKIQIDDNDY